MKNGLYAGSFDPITRGHLDVIRQALTLFDGLYIGVGHNSAKSGLFSPEERRQMILEACAEEFPDDFSRIVVFAFHGSLAQAARAHQVGHIVRAFRQVSDFNDEFGLHGAMEKIAPDLPMVYLICNAQYLHVSSSTARELARLGEDMSWLVTPNVEVALQNRFRSDTP